MCFNCLSFKVAKRIWLKLATNIDGLQIPFGCSGHVCTLNGPVMYIHGGTSFVGEGAKRWLTSKPDLFSLNLDTHLWQIEKPSEDIDLSVMPLVRGSHSGVYINSRILIFGGECEGQATAWVHVHCNGCHHVAILYAWCK